MSGQIASKLYAIGVEGTVYIEITPVWLLSEDGEEIYVGGSYPVK